MSELREFRYKGLLIHGDNSPNSKSGCIIIDHCDVIVQSSDPDLLGGIVRWGKGCVTLIGNTDARLKISGEKK